MGLVTEADLRKQAEEMTDDDIGALAEKAMCGDKEAVRQFHDLRVVAPYKEYNRFAVMLIVNGAAHWHEKYVAVSGDNVPDYPEGI